VTRVEGDFYNVRKFIGSQLRSTSYRVRNSECYRVPGELSENHYLPTQDDSSADEENPIQPEPIPPTPPDISQAISYPADQDVPEPGESDFTPGPSVSDPEDCRFAQAEEMPSVSTEVVHQPRRSMRHHDRRPPAR